VSSSALQLTKSETDRDLRKLPPQAESRTHNVQCNVLVIEIKGQYKVSERGIRKRSESRDDQRSALKIALSSR